MDLAEARTRDFATGARHPWERARLALVAQLVARHVRLDSDAVVLDIGCGDTFVVEQLARLYPEARFYAVDSAFSEELIATFRERLSVANVSLFRSLDGIPPLRKPASLILLMDVIEHVPDDEAFLKDICRRDVFGSDTQVLITVPSYQSLFSAHDRFLGHYRRYSTKALRRLCGAVKLSPIEDGHLFASLLPIRILQVLRERLTGSNDAPPNLAAWKGGESIASLFATFLTVDGRAGLLFSRLGLDLPGLSNFAICRKSA